MKALFDQVCIGCSRLTTQTYTTSFSLGILCLEKTIRDPIYAVYGFVRFADEIVDTFHQFDKEKLFKQFRRDAYEAIRDGISTNPILNSFQAAARQYRIENDLIDSFLSSMETDLHRKRHDDESLREYISGSAEAVGLMCLRIFSKGDDDMYEQLKPYAMRLGAAFQKVNFLRDLQSDQDQRGRTYFPAMGTHKPDATIKKAIEKSIEEDFSAGLTGIKKLPRCAKFGVYLAYIYYLALYRKIKNTPPEDIPETRIRIANGRKATLWAYSFVRYQLNII